MLKSALLDVGIAIIDVLQTIALLHPYAHGKIWDDLIDELCQLTYDFPLPSWSQKSNRLSKEKRINETDNGWV